MDDLIGTINRIVVASRQTMREAGREPTPEELAEKLAIPLEKVRKALDVVTTATTLRAPEDGWPT